MTNRGANNQLRPGEFWALQDVNFQVKPGEVMGVVGNNGAGKSTLINLVAGVLRPTVGKVSLLTNKVVMMSHQGNLDSVQSGRENIINQLSLSGMSKRAIDQSIDAVIDFSEIKHSIDAPAGSYSLGMKLRLSFAIYSQLSPDLFVVDEALNGGDLMFRRKFKLFLHEYIAKGGSILLASHDLNSIQTMCTSCILLDQGQVISTGEPVDVIDTYQKLVGANDDGAEPLAGNSDSMSLFEELGAKPPIDDHANVMRIRSVEITASDGDTLRPGGPAVVRVVCDCIETVAPVVCTIAINGSDSLRLGMVSTVQSELKEGRHVLNCFIDSLPLIPGMYYLVVAFTNPDTGVVFAIKGYFDKPIPLEVMAPPDQFTNTYRSLRSFLHLSASWTTEPTD